MDYIQDYLTLVPRFLPPSAASTLLNVFTTGLGLYRTAQNHLGPLLTRVTTQPDVASILLLVILFFISMKIFNMLVSAVLFWVRLAFRIVLWGGIAIIGFWLYNRGPEGFMEDMGGLAEYWTGEYHKYKGEVNRWQKMNEQQVRMKAKQKGGRGWR